jgi:hypothetical protein
VRFRLEFAAAFGEPGENTADAEAIVLAANRVGDYCERLIERAEDYRSHSIPEQYADPTGACTRRSILDQVQRIA